MGNRNEVNKNEEDRQHQTKRRGNDDQHCHAMQSTTLDVMGSISQPVVIKEIQMDSQKSIDLPRQHGKGKGNQKSIK